MRALIRLTTAIFVLVGLCLAPARAQQEESQAGYLVPFPPGDVYQTRIIGDGLAEGLADALAETLANDSRLQIQKKHRPLSGLMRNDFDEEGARALGDWATKEPFQIAIIMLGTNDRVTWRAPSGKRAAVGSDEWKGELGRRVDAVMKALKKQSVSVYWVGLPSVRRSDANEDAQMINEIIREKAYLNAIRFIDTVQSFADEQGGYSDFGPDLTGKMRRLREPDGVHFTEAGYRKLAHFLERELKRDLTTAKQDRNVPLAGSEAEQSAIRASAAPNPATSANAANPTAKRTANDGVAPSATTSSGAQGEQRADNGKVALRTIGAGGREEVVTLEIVRPAIAASVVALVTRKESADKPAAMGESLVHQIAGGLALVSSVTPVGEAGAARRKISPTQSPYFRVLVKGDRLDAKPGRADELIWPRPEPQPEPEARPAPAEAAPAAPARETPTKSQRRVRG